MDKVLAYRAVVKPRARALGIPFGGIPGGRNAIVDVGKIAVGHTTLNRGRVHTGVTAIWPRGKHDARAVSAGLFSLNGYGELTGSHWIEESGTFEGPITLTNTYSVGTARNGVLRYIRKHWRALQLRDEAADYCAMPVVAETWDGELNDIFGFHVTEAHVQQALAKATDKSSKRPIEEGNVGGGTGMTLFDFKGGTGTSSRIVAPHGTRKRYRVGALAQCNFGTLRDLVVAGVPVGAMFEHNWNLAPKKTNGGSVIVIIATDAPLLPHSLKRLARRASLGIARVGSISEDNSGDIFLAFSTSPLESGAHMFSTETFNALFEGVVQATEEAVINALVAAETIRGTPYPAIDIAALQDCLAYHARLVGPPMLARTSRLRA
jgi:D-aminopeptidase